MQELLIDCCPGISGDMLLAAFYDLGVPKEVIEKPLFDLGLGGSYLLTFSESKSKSLRGIKTDVKILDNTQKRTWKNIRELVLNGNLENSLELKIIEVFDALAKAESSVHGIAPDDICFHEIGSIDSLVDIIGVCAAVNFLRPNKIYCSTPTLGSGTIKTEHGKLSIPSPAVIDLVSKFNIEVSTEYECINDELSTPTGIAIICTLVDSFKLPIKYSLNSYGVGIGNKNLPIPNILRVAKINSCEFENPSYEEIFIQEALIDDQSPEDIASFVEILREAGAYDVSYQSVNMKKNRIGFELKAIVPLEKALHCREIWFKYSNTIGLRERRQGRWVLKRLEGECNTRFGKIKVKQTTLSNGEKYIKPEYDEILKLQKKYNKSALEIRDIIKESMSDFKDLKG
tara:strand:- start:1099 stop:2298 length:1200 start_codon:yes stop_codon:yes gene_type:complete